MADGDVLAVEAKAEQDLDIAADDAHAVPDAPPRGPLDEMAAIREAVQHLVHMQAKEYEQPDDIQFVTLNSAREVVLKRYGRRYLEIFTPNALSNVQLNLAGLLYTFNLSAGFTVLNVPDGSSLTAASGTSQVILLRATNFPMTLTAQGGAPGAATVVRLEDGTSSTLATVSTFHSGDNQSTPSAGGSLLTASVAQIQNPSGTDDTQRETGFDGIPAVGVATGAQQMAQAPISTTINQGGGVTGSTTAQTVTLTATSGTSRGVAWKIQPKMTIQVDTGASQEYVFLTAVAGSTVTGVFKNNHSNGAAINVFQYNQARDATIADGSSPAGVAANATFLWNSSLNSGSGGLELERSANGELDGASGAGTNIAAAYEFNGNGPGGGNYDREANLQGKGTASATLNGAANSGQNQAILNSGNLPAVGQQIIFLGGTMEAAYVQSISSQTLTLTANLQNTHGNGTTVWWNNFAVDGPGANSMNPIGMGVDAVAIYSSGDSNYYLLRAATLDNLSVNSVPMVGPGLYNGTNMDRMRPNIDTGALITASGATTTQTTSDQTNFNGRGIKVVLDMTNVGTGSVTLEIDGKDTASGKYYSILTGAAVTTNSTNVYTIGPGLTAAANSVANDMLPRTWRIKVTANNANATTYTVGASVIW